MDSANEDTALGRGDPGTSGSFRRQFLRASGAATAVGLAGCTLPGADDGGSAAVEGDEVAMFRRDLQRTGYYPDETVPDAVAVNWQFPVNNVGHTAAKSSPLLTPDGETVLIAGDTGWVHAYAPDGELRWSSPTGATDLGFHGSPAIVDGTAYVGGYDGDLYAFDVESGDQVWRTRSSELDGTLAIGSSPAYHDGTLYVIAEYGSPSSGALWAIDPDTGEPTWSDDRMWGQPHPSPTIDLETGRLCAGSNDGVLYCWEYPSLEFLWEFQTGGEDGPDGESKADGEFNLGAEIKGTVAAHEGRGYFGSWDGSFYCVDLEDGEEEWTFETGEVNMSNPAVDPETGIVYMGDDGGYVYALEAASGEESWSANVHGRVIGALTVTAETVLVGSYDTHLYALDKETGERRWRVENRGRVTSAAVPRDGRIYYAERGVFSNYYDEDEETVLEQPGHAYCLVADD